MKSMMSVVSLFAVLGVAVIGLTIGASPVNDDAHEIETGKLPNGYRDWKLISVAREEGKLDDIRAILANDIAVEAFRKGTRPFPDGTIVARLAWALIPSEENNKAFGNAQSFIAGEPKNGIQFMVKDSSRYASTGGWRYFQFDEGKTLIDQTKLKTCFDCHRSIEQRDYVFTRYAP